MKQTTKSLVGMLALLLIGVGIAFAAAWVGKDEEKKAEEKTKSEKLFDFDKAKARALRIEKDGKLVASLTRADDKAPWKVVEPVVTEGDDMAVNSLLDQLAGLKQKKDLGPDEKDGKNYGLDPAPHLAVTVKLDGGKDVGLQLGLDNSFDSTLYARVLGEPLIRIVDGFNKSNYDKSAFDLREKKVAHLDDSAEVKRIEVTGASVKAPYVLEKDGGKWKLAGADADSGVADRVASSIKGLKATAIASENASGKLADFGLDKPKLTVKIGVGAAGGKDTLTRTLILGQPVKAGGAVKTYAKRDDSPTVFEVDQQILKDLDKDPFELQDKALVRNVNREDVKKLVFESPNGKIEIARSKDTPADGGTAEENFTVLAPTAGPSKKWKISSALYSITGLRAAAFEGSAKDLAKYGLDKPRTVTLLDASGKQLARVRIGSEKEGKRYVLADGIDKVARVEKNTVDELPWKPDDALEVAPPAASLPDGGVTAAKAP